jgi:hypothetical protein
MTTTLTRSERIKAAFAANGIDWSAPVVDIIDSLIYDGGFDADEADAIAIRGIAPRGSR